MVFDGNKTSIVQRIIYGMMALVSILFLLNECGNNNHCFYKILIWAVVSIVLSLQAVTLTKLIWRMLLLLLTIYTTYSIWYFVNNMVICLSSTVKYTISKVLSQSATFLVLLGGLWGVAFFLKPTQEKLKNAAKPAKRELDMITEKNTDECQAHESTPYLYDKIKEKEKSMPANWIFGKPDK